MAMPAEQFSATGGTFHPALYLDRVLRAQQQLDERDRLRQLLGRGGLFRVTLDPQGKMIVSKAE